MLSPQEDHQEPTAGDQVVPPAIATPVSTSTTEEAALALPAPQPQQPQVSDTSTLSVSVEAPALVTTPTPATRIETTTTPWTVEAIHITVATTLEDDTPLQINLVDTLGHRVSGPKTKRDDNVFWLPSNMGINTSEFRSNTLSPLFSAACKSAGFAIYMKGWEKSKNYSTFVCQRGRVRPGGKLIDDDEEENGEEGATTATNINNDDDHEGSSSTNNNGVEGMKEDDQDQQAQDDKQSEETGDTNEGEGNHSHNSDSNGNGSATKGLAGIKRRRSSKYYKKTKPPHRPIKGEETKCPFRFNVYWCPTNSRWCLPKQQRGSANHCGHISKCPGLVRLVDMSALKTASSSGSKKKKNGKSSIEEMMCHDTDYMNHKTNMKNGAYRELHPLFVQLSKCVKTKEELNTCQVGMESLHGTLKTMKEQREENGGNSNDNDPDEDSMHTADLAPANNGNISQDNSTNDDQTNVTAILEATLNPSSPKDEDMEDKAKITVI